MSWIYGNRYLTQSEMENNAKLVYYGLKNRGWSLNAICGILGNMQQESTINPSLYQDFKEGNLNVGYGLVQWTPATNYINWANANGYSLVDGDYQLQWIDEESVSFGQWLETDAYPVSFEEFKTSNATVSYLVTVFLKNFERAGSEKLQQRKDYANAWYTYLSNLSSYKPRLNSDGMEGSKYYYSDNVFYLSGYGLPNCTCYAWGRQYELTDEKPIHLCTGDAREWYPYAVEKGSSVGSTPKLGAILCISYEPSGHVAIVEQINEDGSIVISQSAYNSTYFWTETCYKEDGYLPTWAKSKQNAYVQGFIYLNKEYVDNGGNDNPDSDGTIRRISKGFKFVLFNARKRGLI